VQKKKSRNSLVEGKKKSKCPGMTSLEAGGKTVTPNSPPQSPANKSIYQRGNEGSEGGGNVKFGRTYQ